jgi:protein-disulfide isomerase
MNRTGLLLLALMMLWLLAAGCGQTATAPLPEIAAPLERLPTVTPQPSADPATPPLIVATIPTMQPSARPTLAPPRRTADGMVTWSMARLEVSGERYATLGDPVAPVTIVEFADFGCTFCRVHARQTLPLLKEQYIDTGLVYYVYKDLPVVSFQGALAAQAAACAGEQERYWEMHERLSRDPQDWDRDDAMALSALQSYAAELALDVAGFAGCLAEERYAVDVDRDFSEAQALRLFGTPAFFINGRLLQGAQSVEVFRGAIEAELRSLEAGG